MKNYFLIVDTETTQDNLVADFGAIVCDKKGNIVAQCGVLVNGIYNDTANHPLFFTSDPAGIWSKKGQDKRYNMYSNMLENGSRMLASVAAINKWLARVHDQFAPVLTAYNLPFDLNKCNNTGIDLALFNRQFCLWAGAYNTWAHTKNYRNMALQLHAFNAPTQYGNMTFKTNAETMARFVMNNANMPDEPHTALEDARDYELPILKALLAVKGNSVAKLLNPEAGSYNWRNCQVRDWFTVS